MRSVSAALNRVFLAFFGLIIVCASAWFLASGLDAGHHLPGLSAYLAAAQDQFGAILSPRAHWLRAMWCSGISACLRHRSVPASHAGAAQACEFFAEDQRI